MAAGAGQRRRENIDQRSKELLFGCSPGRYTVKGCQTCRGDLSLQLLMAKRECNRNDCATWEAQKQTDEWQMTSASFASQSEAVAQNRELTKRTHDVLPVKPGHLS